MKIQLLLLISAFIITSNCESRSNPSPPTVKPTEVLVFSDLSKSLSKDELTQIAEKSADVLHRFPAPAHIKIFPVPKDDRLSSPLGDYDIKPISATSSMELERSEKQHQENLGKWRAELTRKIYETAKTADNSTQTCLISSLKQALKYFQGFDPSKNRLVLIYISDMIEDCFLRNSLSGCTINQTFPSSYRLTFQKNDISNEIKLSNSLLCSLSNTPPPIRIIALTPYTSYSKVSPQRSQPTLQDLETIWQNIFKAHGFQLTTNKFNINNDYPTNLLE